MIHGLLREGEVANIIAKSKVGKSWYSYSLGMSVVAGLLWMDRFQCEPGRVLLIDNELHDETLAYRVRTVAEAMGVPPEIYRDALLVHNLRGRVRGVYNLADLLTSGPYKLVIIDALYRILPDGASENDNALMAQVYNQIDRYAGATRSAFALIHHASKGNQSDKEITDVGAGAGSLSRAADTHLILRPHREEGVVVLDAALRSWAPIEPLPLRWTFPVWTPDEEINPADLKGRKADNREQQQQRDSETDMAILEHAVTWRSRSELERLTGFGVGRVNRAVARLVNAGFLEQGTEERRGNQCEVYRKSLYAN